MSTYCTIERESLRKIENAAHDIKGICHDIEIEDYANEIIDYCNEPISYNMELSLRGINRLLDNMLQSDYNFTKLDHDVKTIKNLLSKARDNTYHDQ